MTSGVQYQVIPLPAREHSQKVASILENKYKTTSTKRVTLNERFGVLEKGYSLQATESAETTKESKVFLVVHDRNLTSKKEFLESYLAKNPIKSPENPAEEDKENVPSKKEVPKKTNPIDDVEKPFSTDTYVQDITRSILKTV